MSAYLLIPLIELVFAVVLLVLVITSRLRHVARKPFALFLVFMGLWGFFIFMMRSSSNVADAFFWEQFVLVAILSVSVFFFRFTITFTGRRQRKEILYSLYFLYIAFLAAIPTGLVVSGMQIMWYGKAPLIGPLFFPFVLLVYAPIGLALSVLIRHYRQSEILDEKIRDSYVIAGIIMMLVGGTTDYLPSLGINMYPLGIIGNIMFCVMATVAVLRHNILEIRLVLRRGLSYSFVSMLIMGGFASIIYVLSDVFEEVFNPVSLAVTIVAIFIASAVFQPVLSRLQRMVDKWFVRDRYSNLRDLECFARETGDITDLKQLASSLVTTAAHTMRSRGAYLLLPLHPTSNFENYAYYGEGTKERLSFSASGRLVMTMANRDGIIDTHEKNLPDSMDSKDGHALEANRIELLVPLKTSQRLIGALLIGDKLSGESYSAEDRRLLYQVASELAPGIENAHLHEDIERKQTVLKEVTEGILHTLTLAFETRDPYTAGHQRRVSNLASEIAREMGMVEWDIEGVRIMGLLHDVGKIGLPAELLSKPGKINQYEFDMIKTHVQVGHQIIKGIEFPWPILPQVILQHHERMDGSGYPEGLSGDGILLEARILAVSDVVEAMSSHRPYRPARGLDLALEEISQKRGTLYAPEVVDACFRVFQKNEVEELLERK